MAAAVGEQRGSLGAARKLARSNAARDDCLFQRAGRPSSPPGHLHSGRSPSSAWAAVAPGEAVQQHWMGMLKRRTNVCAPLGRCKWPRLPPWRSQLSPYPAPGAPGALPQQSGASTRRWWCHASPRPAPAVPSPHDRSQGSRQHAGAGAEQRAAAGRVGGPANGACRSPPRQEPSAAARRGLRGGWARHPR